MTKEEDYDLGQEQPKPELQSRSLPLACCNPLLRHQTDDATAFALGRMGNGPVLYSNVLLSASLLYLAKVEAGCDGDDDAVECEKVYGFLPSSIITLIGTISGLMAAILLPFIGAIIDSTNYRRTCGMITATLLISIQAVQIYTVQSTWFPMAILQAINGFLYQVLVLCFYAYLPEIARDVGEETMNKYTAGYYMYIFGTEFVFAVVVIAIAIAFSMSNVPLGMLGQALDVPVSGLLYFLAWRYFTHKEAKRELGPNESLLTSGFVQVFRTAKGIYDCYSSTVGLFLLAVILLEAAANAFTLVAVTYLESVVGLSGIDVGIIFIIVMISTIPGSLLSRLVTSKTNPMINLRIQLCAFMGFNFAAFLTMTSEDDKMLAYIYAVVWGVLLGWFYPAELLIFSMIMPKDQEAELSGFFIYCTQILGWLPPLIFTIMNENGINLSWGGIHLNGYFFFGFCLTWLMPTWQICMIDTSGENRMSMKASA